MVLQGNNQLVDLFLRKEGKNIHRSNYNIRKGLNTALFHSDEIFRHQSIL
jgi:hypothetical protein